MHRVQGRLHVSTIGLPRCSLRGVASNRSHRCHSYKGAMFRYLEALCPRSLVGLPNHNNCFSNPDACLRTTSFAATRRQLHSCPPAVKNVTGPTVIEDVALQHHHGIARVVLKKGKAQLFRDGTPMVYSGAVDCIIGQRPKSGDAVLVLNPARQSLAWGVYNSTSMFCVRIMQTESDAARDPASILNVERLIQERIVAAVALRRQFGLPSEETNVYRLVNSEGDRLSGLIADVHGGHIVVASSAYWVEKYRSEIEDALVASTRISSIVWRPSTGFLEEEGLNFEDSSSKSPDIPWGLVEVVENGVKYKTSLAGQKTGFYADQRDSRLAIRALCKDKTVLDLCCYSGGFSLNAALGGASHVIGVDSSGPAVDLAVANASLNNLDPSSCTFVKANVSVFLSEAIAQGRAWDVVVLDPPKLAPSKKVLDRASSRYQALNSLAMRVVKPYGLLMTCSCSGAMTQSGTFLSVLKDASTAVGRRLVQLRYAGAAPDHALDLAYPEGEYLSNVLLRVL